MTETQERFLRAVLERVDASRVAEFHLFPPIRRGTVETGVAVLAVLPEAGPAAEPVADEPVAAGTEPAVALVVDAPAQAEADAPVGDEYADAPDLGIPVDGDALAIAAALAEPPDLDAPVDGDMLTIAAAEGVAPDVDAPVDGDALTIAAAAEAEVIAAEATAPVADDAEPVEVAAEAEDDTSIEDAGDADEAHDIAALLDDSPYAPAPAAEPVVAAEPVAEPRARIITASYRWTIKGPERGTWTVDVQEQAEAPLSAVEAVLRGVRQRSSEPADPESVPVAMLLALLAPVELPVAGTVGPAPAAMTPAVVADAA